MLVRNHSLREYLLIHLEGEGIFMCVKTIQDVKLKTNFQILLKIAHCIHSSGPLFFLIT